MPGPVGCRSVPVRLQGQHGDAELLLDRCDRIVEDGEAARPDKLPVVGRRSTVPPLLAGGPNEARYTGSEARPSLPARSAMADESAVAYESEC